MARLKSIILTSIFCVPTRVKALYASCMMNQGRVVQIKPSSSHSKPSTTSHNQCIAFYLILFGRLYMVSTITTSLVEIKNNKERHTSRGLKDGNTQLGKISPIGYFKTPIGDILPNWGLVICFLSLRYQTHIFLIPNWIY